MIPYPHDGKQSPRIGRAPRTPRRTPRATVAVGVSVSALALMAVVAPISPSSARPAHAHVAHRTHLSWPRRRAAGSPPGLIYVLRHRSGVARLAARRLLAPSGRRTRVAARAAALGSVQALETLAVCPSGCAFSQIGPAIALASPGDTIQVARGTYSGGFTIDKGLNLVGAGAGLTIISGGGPVVTIGTFGAASEPTVSIAGVTITGGVTRSSPESTPFVGQDGVIALGGGVEIPPNADFTGGATVTITDSVITGNLVAPTAALPLGPPCPSGPCPFALAAGGGIDNWGTLTLDRTTVSSNRVGTASGLSALASDAYAGAIYGESGSLTITNSIISGNQASATSPDGRFADSGAIFAEGGTLTMSASSVTNNGATLNAAWPNSVDTLAIAGGIHISASGSIRNTTVSGNTVTMTNKVGDANAFSGGVHTDVNFELDNDVITNNSVSAATLGRSRGNAAGDSGAGEWGGTLTNTRVSDNSVSASSVAGQADAEAGGTIFAGSMTNSVISNNHVQASSPHSSATSRGGGLVGGDAITLRNTTASGNTASANSRSGFALGGGIFDADLSPNGPPGGPLTLINSRITDNALSGSAAITLSGGGIYATNPVSLTNSAIADNIPDQCAGC
jgi:hypothetical protein